MPSGLILSEGKTPTYVSQNEKTGNITDGYCRRGPNEFQDKDYPQANGLLVGCWSEQLLILMMGNCP